MPIANLRRIRDVRALARRVEKREQRIRQDHQPAAEPSEIFRVNELAFLAREPGHQPIDARVQTGGPEQNDKYIEVEERAKTVTLPDVVLEHVEDLEALPKKKERH